MHQAFIGNNDHPLAVRIRRASFASTMLAVLLIGTLSLIITLTQIPAAQRETHQTAAAVIASALGADIDSRLAEVRRLAGNSMVWTALTDSAGRDTYLRPFLEDREKFADEVPLQLLDYRARTVLGALPVLASGEETTALVKQVIKEHKAGMRIVARGGRAALVAVYPVMFPYTRDSIGALAAAIPLTETFLARTTGLADDLAVELLNGQELLGSHPQNPGEGFHSVDFPLPLHGYEGSTDALRLRIYTTHNPWLKPVLQQAGLWLLLAALLGTLAWRLSNILAARITRRLDRLASACGGILDGRPLQLEEDLARDEIGVLSRALRRAIGAYEEVNGKLEQRVAEKTRALSASEARFREVFENNASVMLLISPTSGSIVSGNVAAIEYYGYPESALLGSPIGRLDPAPHHTLREVIERIRSQGSMRHTASHRLASGRMRDVEIYSTLVETQPEALIVSIVHDVTERKRAEEQLRLAANVFSQAREGIMITTTDGEIIDVNDAFIRITGYRREEVIGHNPRMFSSGRHDQAFYAALWNDLSTKGHWYGEIWNRRSNGDIYPELKTISAVYDDEGRARHYVALFSDITAIKENERQLERVAHYDALTTLPNRVLLGDRLNQAMAQARRRGKPLAVLYLDLDGFKAVNDGHGHEAGDLLLATVANRMKQTLREGDTLARLGGDEFVAVLHDIADMDDCRAILERLLQAASQPVTLDSGLAQVSASIGVSLYPQEDELAAEQLLRQADQAMYRAKLQGKNRYHFFDEAQDRSVRGYYEGIDRMRQALAEQEFRLYYQPRVNMRSGEVIGVEALIRWAHPERGLLSPADFLPVVEDDQDLAVRLGEWVLTTALEDTLVWQQAGLQLQVSVNIGARQLQQSDFVARLRDMLLARPALPRGALRLEVLETSALEDMARAKGIIESCREIGVEFALDDFGTGYCSLSYLKNLPVTELKIDQSFVRDMLDDPDDLAILDGVLGLATAFRRQVVAEGVESIEHGSMLLQLGCEHAQGYGIARPMPPAELPGWIAGWQPHASWRGVPPPRRANLPVLYAVVEHRAWIVALDAYLRGKRDTPPILDQDKCRFGAWLRELPPRKAQDQEALLNEIRQLHEDLHLRAEALCQLRRDAGAPTGEMPRLKELSQRLVARLQALADSPFAE